MRRACATACALLVLLPAGGAQARRHHHKPKPTCTPKGAKTVEAGARVRVFTLTKGDSTNLYACRLSNKKRFLLASADEAGGTGDSVSLVRVAGRFVAWDSQPFDDSERYNPDFQGFPSGVHALDTSTGKRRTAPATSGNPSASTVTALVLNPSGSFAWIGSGGALEVHRYDATGDTILDSGTGIDPASLAASAAQLYWLNAGAPRTASFG
ncbi:MAG TPA: hypothetical protein VH817_10755 [Thermoleophilaceae bacterium]|jgi:hypothetical protein